MFTKVGCSIEEAHRPQNFKQNWCGCDPVRPGTSRQNRNGNREKT